MALYNFSASDLITSVRNRGSIPTAAGSGITDDDILRYANEEIHESIAPIVLRVKEEYFVWTETIELTGGVSKYRINPRSMGNKLRDVMYLDEGGNSWSLPLISREHIDYYEPSTGVGYPDGFYLEGNDLILIPNLTNSPVGVLEVSFFFTPSQLVASSQARQITAVDTATNTITVDSIPTNFTSSSIYDIHSQFPGAEPLRFDLTVASIDSGAGTITFNTGTDKSIDRINNSDPQVQERLPVQVGDWVCVQGQSARIQLPKEAHALVAQATVCRVLEAMGDSQGLQNAAQKLMKMESQLISLLEGRVQGAKKKLVNRGGVLWRGRAGGGRGTVGD